MKNVMIVVLCLLAFSFSHAQEFRLGVLVDAELSPALSTRIDAIQQEIQKTIGTNKKLVLAPDHILSANWEIQTAAAAYRQLVPKCDLILLLGAASTKGALEAKPFQVPTLALGILDPELQGVPLTPAQTSGLSNFSYILSSPDLKKELTEFRKLTPFEHLVVLVDQKTTAAIDPAIGRARIRALETEFRTKVDVVALGADIEASLQELPAGADAVYMAIPYERSPDEVQEIANALIARKLPAFAMNKMHVDQGMLACLSDENGFGQIIRKLSIMADDAFSGQPLADMPVRLNQREGLFFNAVTARKIGLSPSFETLFTAQIVGDQSDIVRERLSLEEVIAIALAENLDIQVSEQDRALASMDVKFAKSSYLPDASLNVNGTELSKNLANPLAGQSQRSLAGNVGVQQVIFSEKANANIAITRYLQKAQDFATQQVINDLILDAYLAYLSILKSKTNITIQQENLAASQKNLELAQIRAQVGSKSKADIYRWESEVATAKQSLIEAFTGLALSKMQLYVYLNGKIADEFDIEDVSLEDSLFLGLAGSGLGKFIQGPVEYQKLSEFLVLESQARYPTKLQLMTNQEALARQRKLYKRLYYLPTLAASAQANSTLLRGGEASEPLPGSNFVNNSWNAVISLSYPIFNQNSRRLNLQDTEIQQQQLDYQIGALDQNLRLGITNQTLRLLTAQTNISFSRTSAENMALNFDLIQQAYKQGQATVTQLVDAQRTKIQAQQAFALSIYEYMEAFIGLENRVGAYSSFSTPEENASFEQRIIEYVLAPQN